MKYKLFTTPMCPKCPAMKEFMTSQDKVHGDLIDAHTPEGLAEARRFNVSAVPLVVFVDDSGAETQRCATQGEVEEVLAKI
jgi:glutaredoxin